MLHPDSVNWEKGCVVINAKGQRRFRVEVTCPDCNEVRYVTKGSIRRLIKNGSFTGRCQRCRIHYLRGENHPAWQGGHCLGSNGKYISLMPNHPFFCMADCRNKVKRQRLIMAEHLGRPLRRDEHVHHINGDGKDNRLGNLALMTESEHHRFEALLRYGRVNREEVGEYALSP